VSFAAEPKSSTTRSNETVRKKQLRKMRKEGGKRSLEEINKKAQL